MNTPNRNYFAHQSQSPVVLGVMEYGKIGGIITKGKKFRNLSVIRSEKTYIIAGIGRNDHIISKSCTGNDLIEKPEKLVPDFGHPFYIIEQGSHGEPNKIVFVYIGSKVGIEKMVPSSVNKILIGETLH